MVASATSWYGQDGRRRGVARGAVPASRRPDGDGALRRRRHRDAGERSSADSRAWTAAEDTALTQSSLGRLKAVGVRLVIDDFGTGYSSLSYLRRFPIDGVKIDRSFIDAVDTDREEANLVRSIITLSRRLKLETVAEGIERWGQLARLRALGADIGQGYYLSTPLEASAVADFARCFNLEEPAIGREA